MLSLLKYDWWERVMEPRLGTVKQNYTPYPCLAAVCAPLSSEWPVNCLHLSMICLSQRGS